MHHGATQPAHYCVVVRGPLGRTFADAFEHLELETSGGQSSLTGTFADPAQLYGLLDRLRDLGIDVVSVNPVPDEPSTRDHPPEDP